MKNKTKPNSKYKTKQTDITASQHAGSSSQDGSKAIIAAPE